MISKTSILLVMIVAWVVASSALSGHAETPLSREYQIKAAFLYNFAKFVEWPAQAFANPDTPLTLGVLGEDPFGVVLESITDKTIKGRKLAIKRVVGARDLGVHILFISSSEKEHLLQILEALKGSSILTVGEMKQFGQLGGIINFIIDGNKVRFEVNPDAARQAGLKIDSRLLDLAKIVRAERGE